MDFKKFFIICISMAFLLSSCSKSPFGIPSPTVTPTLVPLTETSTAVPELTATPVPSMTVTPAPTTTIVETATPTATTVPPTATPTLVPPTATAQPVSPTYTPVLDWGSNWTLADVRYGVHQDKLRVVIEMTQNRTTMPSYDIQEVENATVPFPTGPDPSWGESRIDLVISDLYANNNPILSQLPLIPPTNQVVTRIGQYPTFDDSRLGFSIGLHHPSVFKIYELTNPVRIVIDILFTEPEITVTPTPNAILWDTFTNPHYAVTFKYPSHWTVDPTFSTPENGYTSYHGEDGFFMINAADAESLDAYTASEANHILKPYGSAPTIENLTIQGQAARLIMPSEDQSMPDQAALIVVYPQPVSIGDHSYPFFVMYTDIDYIRAIANTVFFDYGQ